MQAGGLSCARIEQADAMGFDPGKTFDAVVVTGAVVEIPDRFRRWLKPGGRMVAVRGLSPVQEAIAMTRDGDAAYRIESLFETDIPYLRGAAPITRFAL